MMRVTVRDRIGEREVDAWSTPTPGLVIAYTGTCFSVTHLRSGLALAFSDSPENAMRLAVECAGTIDWTMSGPALRHDDAAKSTARAMARQADIEGNGYGTDDPYDVNGLTP